jgi:hypothetical protein
MEQKHPQMELTQGVNDTILETICEWKGRNMPLQQPWEIIGNKPQNWTYAQVTTLLPTICLEKYTNFSQEYLRIHGSPLYRPFIDETMCLHILTAIKVQKSTTWPLYSLYLHQHMSLHLSNPLICTTPEQSNGLRIWKSYINSTGLILRFLLPVFS